MFFVVVSRSILNHKSPQQTGWIANLASGFKWTPKHSQLAFTQPVYAVLDNKLSSLSLKSLTSIVIQYRSALSWVSFHQ